MPRKPQRPRPKNDPVQHKRFIDMAREVEVDETPGALDRAFERIAERVRSAPAGKKTK
jgi:hypothetical protein